MLKTKVYAIYFVKTLICDIIYKKNNGEKLGLIKRIKKMFSKNIDCSEEIENKLMHLYITKNREITVGANIIVPDDFVAVFVCKNKVCDVLLSGKYAISGANLPKTFSRMKLGKANKKGKYKKRFAADVYFISRKKHTELEFESYDKYAKKDPKFGMVKAHCQGVFDIEITGADKLLKYLLSERALVRQENFLDILSGLVGNYVNRKLETCFEDFYSILTSPRQVNEKLNIFADMEGYFEDYGFKISNIVFQSLNVSSKLKNRVEDELKKDREISHKINEQLNFDLPLFDSAKTSIQESVDNSINRCASCGHVLNPSARFCEKCGSKVNNLN